MTSSFTASSQYDSRDYQLYPGQATIFVSQQMFLITVDKFKDYEARKFQRVCRRCHPERDLTDI